MEDDKFTSTQILLKKLKDLYSKFVNVVDQINVNDSIFKPNNSEAELVINDENTINESDDSDYFEVTQNEDSVANHPNLNINENISYDLIPDIKGDSAYSDIGNIFDCLDQCRLLNNTTDEVNIGGNGISNSFSEVTIGKQNLENVFNNGNRSGDSAYLNKGNDGRVHDQFHSFENLNDAGSSGIGDSYSNLTENLRLTIRSKKQVMGIDLPESLDFNEGHSEAILNTVTIGKQNLENVFNNGNRSGDSAYLNKGNDCRVHDQFHSFENLNDAGSSGIGDSYSNLTENLRLTIRSKKQVMGIDLPESLDFNEGHSEAILNTIPTDTTNYLYYLLDDNVAHDVVDVRDRVNVGFGSSELHLTLPNVLTQTTYESPSKNTNVESSSIGDSYSKIPTDTTNYLYYLLDDNVAHDVVDVRDRVNVGFGSSELHLTLPNVLTQTTYESPSKNTNVESSSIGDSYSKAHDVVDVRDRVNVGFGSSELHLTLPNVLTQTTYESPSKNTNVESSSIGDSYSKIPTDTTNYLYYLLDDNVAHDVVDVRDRVNVGFGSSELHLTLPNVLTQTTYESPSKNTNVESSSIGDSYSKIPTDTTNYLYYLLDDNVAHDVVDVRDRVNVGFGSSELHLTLPNVLTQTTYESPSKNTNVESSSIGDSYSKIPTDTTNYLYYLLDDNVAHDVVDVRDRVNVGFGSSELHLTLPNVLTQTTYESPSKNTNVESSSIGDSYSKAHDSLDVVDVRDHVNVGFGSTELHSPTFPNVLIQPPKESPSKTSNATPFNIDIKRHRGCDKLKMFVPTSDSKTKPLCCIYCHKRYLKLVRHLETVHKGEEDVKKFRDLPIGSKERREIIDMIRKRGQFEWNSNPEINGGELSTSRRPNKKFERKPTYFIAYAKCLGEFSTKTLRAHWNKCTNNAMKGERVVKELGRAVEGRVHSKACDDLNEKVYARMRDNEFIGIIRFDWLITEFGNDLCLNYSPHYQNSCIRSPLRQAGKLLVALRSESSEITDFASLYHVKNCNAVVQAIRAVSRFDIVAKIFGSPGTASSLVTLINNIGELLEIERMKQNNTVEEKIVKRFLKLFKKDVKLKILKLVSVQQTKAKRLRNENIPTTDDINRLVTYLDYERNKCFAELRNKYSKNQWTYLNQLTLVSTLVFNRRRTGEMSNITVDDFHRRQIFSEQCNKSVAVIPEITKETIRSSMKIRGKLNRAVPVLLKHSYDDCIQLLLQHRQDAGVSERNEYLFAVPMESGKILTVNSCEMMRKFSDSCEAYNPSSLRGTKLRKHFASLCSTMNLTDNDITNVASFMGHDDAVHRNVYRHNPLQQVVVKMTALLETAQGNTGSTNVSIASESSLCEKKVVTTKMNGNCTKNRAKITGTAKSPARKIKKTYSSRNVITTSECNSDTAKGLKRKIHQSEMTQTKRARTKSRR